MKEKLLQFFTGKMALEKVLFLMLCVRQKGM